MPDSRNRALDVQVLRDPQSLAHAAAERFVRCADAAMAAANRFVVALAGGSTPQTLYTLLATDRYAACVDWQRVHVYWGDERCVAPDHAQSNYRMARAALLDHVAIPTINVQRIRGEDDPTSAAASYENLLRAQFATPIGPPSLAQGKRFDLILLGMGDNGHTASLFPGSPLVHEPQRWVAAEYVAEVSMWRVTLTPVVINAAAEVMFLVAGADKATMLQRVLAGAQQERLLPAQVVAPLAGRVTWLVDSAAAGTSQT